MKTTKKKVEPQTPNKLGMLFDYPGDLDVEHNLEDLEEEDHGREHLCPAHKM